MKDTFFFSHDYNARTDTKIKKLLARHGMQGYGIFWAIVEDLYNNANALQMDTEVIAYDLRVECDLVNSILTDFDLFIISNEVISSKSVQDRIEKRNEKSIKASESAKARWENKGKNANAMRTHTEGNANKGKESKVKDIKEEIDTKVSMDTHTDSDEVKAVKTTFKAPSQEEVQAYFKEKNKCSDQAAKAFTSKFWSFYENNGWKVGKNKMKNWRLAIDSTWSDTAEELIKKYQTTQSVNSGYGVIKV